MYTIWWFVPENNIIDEKIIWFVPFILMKGWINKNRFVVSASIESRYSVLNTILDSHDQYEFVSKCINVSWVRKDECRTCERRKKEVYSWNNAKNKILYVDCLTKYLNQQSELPDLSSKNYLSICLINSLCNGHWSEIIKTKNVLRYE